MHPTAAADWHRRRCRRHGIHEPAACDNVPAPGGDLARITAELAAITDQLIDYVLTVTR